MTHYPINARINGVATPPIAEVQGWIQHRKFPDARPLLDVSQAVPSYAPADELLHHVERALHHPATALYTDIEGIPELRGAMAAHLTDDYAGHVEPGQIAITAGCNQAFAVAIDALAGPGDEVILPLPYYFNHHMWLEMRGIRPRFVSFTTGQQPAVAPILDRVTPTTRAVVLVSPNNPTGTEYPLAFISTLFDAAKQHGFALVIDETYKDFRTDPGPPHDLLQRAGWDRNLIQLFSFSKSYAMTGYRVGAMAASPELIEQVAKIIDSTTICPSHIGQTAALYGLTHLTEWRQQKANMLRQRIARLRECFDDSRLRYQLACSGAYFAYVRHPFDNLSAYSVARRLADDFNILSLPGPMFGPDQEPYMRFAFANLEAGYIPELVERLIESQ